MRSVAGVIESVWGDPDPAEKRAVTAGSAADVMTRQAEVVITRLAGVAVTQRAEVSEISGQEADVTD
jgi:hypothetical protein